MTFLLKNKGIKRIKKDDFFLKIKFSKNKALSLLFLDLLLDEDYNDIAATNDPIRPIKLNANCFT